MTARRDGMTKTRREEGKREGAGLKTQGWERWRGKQAGAEGGRGRERRQTIMHHDFEYKQEAVHLNKRASSYASRDITATEGRRRERGREERRVAARGRDGFHADPGGKLGTAVISGITQRFVYDSDTKIIKHHRGGRGDGTEQFTLNVRGPVFGAVGARGSFPKLPESPMLTERIFPGRHAPTMHHSKQGNREHRYCF